MRPRPPRPKSLSSDKGLHGPLFFEGLSRLREDASLEVVASLARKKNITIYLVGGMVRNSLLNEDLPRDFDFICEGEVRDFAAEVAGLLGGAAFILDRKNGLYRVAVKKQCAILTMDFLPLRFSCLEDDLLQRDFTVNAMALPLASIFGESPSYALIDPLHGVLDCEKKVLRLVSKRALKEDPLRCLRAVRLSQRYGLSIDKDTESQIREHAPLIEKKPVSRERVRDELCLIFEAPGTDGAIADIVELGLLGVTMPSVRSITRPGFFLETPSALKTLKETELVISEIEAATFPCHAHEVKSFFDTHAAPPSATLTLKLAAFFHDIDTSRCEVRGGKDGSGEIGTYVSPADILKELLFGNKTVRAVKGLLRAMERFSKMPLEICDRPAVMALLFDKLTEEAGGVTPLFFVLAAAGSRQKNESPSTGRYGMITAMTEFYFDTYITSPPPPFFTGEEIIKAFNLNEGERVGLVKQKIEEALLSGLISNKREAVEYIKKKIT